MILPCFRLEWTPVHLNLLVRFYSDASYCFTFLRISVGVEKREIWDLLRAVYISFFMVKYGVPMLKCI